MATIKFERISLELVLASPDAEDKDLEQALRLAEESVCPVWQMLKNNVEVAAEYRIERTGPA